MRSRTTKRWTLPPADARVEELAERLKTSRLVAQLLLNRGVADVAAGQAFLRPQLKALHDPATLPGLPPAAARIARAIADKEPIVIYGDYDVDGITASSILWHAVRLLGGDVRTYIPHRVDEGYGLNSEAVTQLIDDGCKLLVTVDCGITAIDPIAAARNRGVDVIVSDHHEWRQTPDGQDLFPDTPFVVHPRLPGHDTYPNPHLCGAGVAFKLAWGVGQAVAGGGRVPEVLKNFLVEAMALAALGTIADVVPLVGENRILAHFGLGGLKHTKLVGVRALIDSADLTSKNIDSYHVGFLLAPRLNAAGRMGHARLAVEMLTTATEQRAADIAIYLEQQNKQRQTTERQILASALAQIEALKLADNRAIVVGDLGWHPGVIGIVASRIVDRFHRPAVVVAMGTPEEGGLGLGSGRSIDGFHLSKALAVVGHLLESHGGHEMAAGLKVKCEQFPAFRDAFGAHAGEAIDDAMLVPTVRVDADAELSVIDETLVQDLARLGPFGRGNPKPMLRCEKLTLTADAKRIGKTGDHLTFLVRHHGPANGTNGGGRPMKAIAFGAGDLAEQLSAGSVVNLCVQPTINEFNGYRNVELEVKDLQVVGKSA